MSVPEASLVVPVRNESGNIAPLIEEIRAALDTAVISWELFIVDDGSSDDSWLEIVAAGEADSRVRGIRLTMGQGKSAALVAGFSACQARQIVMLDGDGQDDPAEIPKMLARLKSPGSGLDARGSKGADMVNGWKTPRLDPWHKTFPSHVFNLLVGWLTGLRLHDHNCGLKVFCCEVIRSIQLTTDMHRFLPVLAAAQGFRVVEVPVHHRPRTRGISKYGLSRFFRGLLDLARVAVMVRGKGRVGGPPLRGQSRARLRQSVYAILATLAMGSLLGRIGAVSSVDTIALEKRLIKEELAKATRSGDPFDANTISQKVILEKRLQRPFLSANDRSRWLTIRAIVEKGTFAIDELVAEPGWDTIDAVAHPDASGRLRLYSSKPPLLSVIYAGPYWLLAKLSGWTLKDHPFEMGRLLMVLYGLLPLGLTIYFTCRLIDSIGTSDFSRIWAAALIASGTLLTTFAVVLTNHVPAAACVAASAWLVQRIRSDGLRAWWAFAATGFFAGLAAALELPAMAWCAASLAIVVTSDAKRALIATLPSALLVAAAFLGTNWLAHGTISPPYAHRGASGNTVEIAGGQCCTVPTKASLMTGTPATSQPAADGSTLKKPIDCWNPDNWYDYSFTLATGRVVTSYWRSPKGVDRGEPSSAKYAWHVLVGHHGIFSLTPAWLLLIPGLAILLSKRRRESRAGEADLAWAIATVSLVVIAFYLSRPTLDRNYGGMTSGFRWALWLAPLWVAAAVPAADSLARNRFGRGLCLLLLGMSVVSVAYPTWNPWTAPWIEQWLVSAGWITAL